MAKIKKIDFILPTEGRNSRIGFLSREFAKAFEKLNVKTRLLIPPKDKNPVPFLDDLYAYAPDCTISFNGILPDQEGHFLADMIRLPHIAILTDSPNGFIELAKSRYTTTLSPDQQYLDILKKAGCERTLFFPLAAPIDPEPVLPLNERRGSILMAPAWLNGEAIKTEWRRQMPPALLDFLEEVIYMTLSQPEISYYHAFQQILSERSESEQQTIRPWTTFSLFNQIEAVLRETDIVELLRALKGMDVDLVVQIGLVESWRRRLGAIADNFRFHEGVSFENLEGMIRQAKIFLTSSPQFKFGTNGDLYTSLLYGAYTFHNRSEFLEWAFRDGRGCFFYPYLDHAAIVSRATEVLSHPELFQEELEVGRRHVIEQETWIQRGELLLDWIPHFLDELPNALKLALHEPR
jgi:hypothetical protein